MSIDSSKPLVANQPAKKTDCQTVNQVFEAAYAENFSSVIVIGEDKYGTISVLFYCSSRPQVLWHLVVAMINLLDDRKIGSSQEPSAESDSQQSRNVKKTLEKAQTKFLNKVIVVGEVGDKTVMSSSGFSKKRLLSHLTTAADSLLYYRDQKFFDH